MPSVKFSHTQHQDSKPYGMPAIHEGQLIQTDPTQMIQDRATDEARDTPRIVRVSTSIQSRTMHSVVMQVRIYEDGDQHEKRGYIKKEPSVRTVDRVK